MNNSAALAQAVDPVRLTDSGDFIHGCEHTVGLLNHRQRNKLINTTISSLKEFDLEYDSIACCGTSGVMIVPFIAEKLNKNIILVRKEDKRYSTYSVEGVISRRYIIIDDLICTGATIRHIISTISNYYKHWVTDKAKPECVGSYLYMTNQFHEGSCFKQWINQEH
jgi:adenine/guanine phosphoribosyltransferase-like PRPP-binding protein